MAIVDDTPQEKDEGPSLVIQAALLAGVSVAALGIGWAAGYILNGLQPERASAMAEEPVKASETTLAETHAAASVVYLEPVTTNLAGPGQIWVRLEYALVFRGPADAETARLIQQDTLSWLRTVKAQQLEGPSGLMHLKSDLRERAAQRSDGRVRDILIKTLLFE